jgi:Lipase (class 3)
MQTLTRRTGVPPRDILVAKWASTSRRPAYFLVRDHDRRALVLSIRGTFSMDDILTDLCCTTSEINIATATATATATGETIVSAAAVRRRRPRSSFFGSTVKNNESSLVQRALTYWGYNHHRRNSSVVKCRAHSGMLQAAESLRSELANVLEAELQSAPAYSLVLVGHSMAGGIAALLGVLLRQKYTNVKVFAYGPAPCVSLPAHHHHDNNNDDDDNNECTSMSQYITSVIHENDPFKAMSLQHVAALSCKLSKLCADHQLRDAIIARLSTKQRSSRLNDAWLVSIFRNDLYQPHSSDSVDKLYPPGKVILLSRREKKRGFRHLLSRRRLSVREITGQCYFDDLEFPSFTGLSLHAPTSYEECLRNVVVGP